MGQNAGNIYIGDENGKARKVVAGGSSVVVEELNVNYNGTFIAEEGTAYSPVNVNVPQTTISFLSITKNGTYTAPSGTAYSPILVNVEPFSFVVKGSGSFTTYGNVNVNFGETSSDYNGNAQTVNFSYNDEKAHRIVITGRLTYISFQNCTGLVRVDVPFPKTMNAAEFLSTVFDGCTSLVSIPHGLFDNCTSARQFARCFANCGSLSSIPEGLFDNCTTATTFNACFMDCTSLTAIPGGLFDSCTAVQNFALCFEHCSALTGPAPELWDTTKWPNVVSSSSCFRGCTGLSNYTDIPSDWK